MFDFVNANSDLCNKNRHDSSPFVGLTNFQPMMFDMEAFGGTKAPVTKYQNCDCNPAKLENPKVF